MFICLAVLETDNGEIVRYNIVTKKEEQKFECEPIRVHISTPIADEIMNAITNEKDEIICNNVHYNILTVSINSNFNNYNPYYRRKVNFSSLKYPQKIYIYKHSSVCLKCVRKGIRNNIENVIADIGCILNKYDTYQIDIQFCKSCKRYFVDEQSLRVYEKKWGPLLFERIKESGNSEYFTEFSYAEDTVLSRYGYSAQQGSTLSKKERQGILTFLIESGISNKSEIKTILSKFIDLRGGRCYMAVPIWREDLFFVNQYNIENQRYIGLGKIEYTR